MASEIWAQWRQRQGHPSTYSHLADVCSLLCALCTVQCALWTVHCAPVTDLSDFWTFLPKWLVWLSKISLFCGKWKLGSMKTEAGAYLNILTLGWCLLCSQGTIYCEHYSVHCDLSTVQYQLYIGFVHCLLSFVHYALWIVQFHLCRVHCAVTTLLLTILSKSVFPFSCHSCPASLYNHFFLICLPGTSLLSVAAEPLKLTHYSA